MNQLKEDNHLVYLLKRKSDSQQYVGITVERRMKQRFGDHKRSNHFKNDEFEYKILEESPDRSYIESREEYWISKLDTFKNGLNGTPTGKGFGHRSPKFTTYGYCYSKESRKKMSESGKKRAQKEKEKRRKISKDLWKNKEYRKNQEGKRRGKRLRPPVLSDDQVKLIRNKFELLKPKLIAECEEINQNKKNRGYPDTTPHGLFAKRYHEDYSVSYVLIRDIVNWKTRKNILPALYKS